MSSVPSSPDVPHAPMQAYRGTDAYIFVSSAAKDNAKVLVELSRLHAAGYRLWFDESPEPRSDWTAAIQKAIKGCAFFLLFLTRRSLESLAVCNQIKYALRNDKRFLVVDLDETTIPPELGLPIDTLPAIHKPQMSPDEYHRKLLGSLPPETLDRPRSARAPKQSAARILAQLDPASDYLLQLQPAVSLRPWQLRHPCYTIGREHTTILLPDKHVSRKHAVLVRLGPQWVAINVSVTKRLWINGQDVRQKILCEGDVLRIGNSWLVFLSGNSLKSRPPLCPMPGRWSMPQATGPAGPVENRSSQLTDETDENNCVHTMNERPVQNETPGASQADAALGDEPEARASCRVIVGQESVVSDSADRPLLIGSDPRCSIVLAGKGVAPFHCFLSWLPQGLWLCDLDTGLATLLEGKPVKSAEVHHGQKIKIGSHTLTLELQGDPTEPDQRRTVPEPHGLGLTAMQGPHKGETAILPADQTWLLGRVESADLLLDREERISRRQLGLGVRKVEDEWTPLQLVLRDVSQRDSAWLNSVRIGNSAMARPGDIIHFSEDGNRVIGTALVVHYDLTEGMW